MRIFLFLLLIFVSCLISKAYANETNAQLATIGCTPRAVPNSYVMEDKALVVRVMCSNGRAAVLFTKDETSKPDVRDCGPAPRAYPQLSGSSKLIELEPCMAWKPKVAEKVEAIAEEKAKTIPTTVAADPDPGKKKLELKAIDPRISNELNNQKCVISRINGIYTTGIFWGTRTMAGVTCADGRVVAAMLKGGKVEVRPCTAGEKEIKFSDDTKGDYCAL